MHQFLLDKISYLYTIFLVLILVLILYKNNVYKKYYKKIPTKLKGWGGRGKLGFPTFKNKPFVICWRSIIIT